ncbi:MAG: 30S ribosome-binding factor RbfA [Planctomycetales bacterium]|nr:30S ribosome-binding factor RbfA [Planctomycetales bacterium]MCA9170981.1 30S ribosome-binding factor RbfA [Planctomycetales bacterium]
MSSRRTLKAASAIREVVSMAILTELRDPRVKNVTVTLVELSGDMRQAKIHVSIMGDARQQDLCMHGLKSSAGFLQQKIGDRIDTRYTPRLQFVLDKGVKHSFKVAEILNDVLPTDSDHEVEEGVSDDDPIALMTDLGEDGTDEPSNRTD